jgi:hypothetical protein
MACELTEWMQMLALDGAARAWEPKRLRLRIAATWLWASQLTTAITRLQAFAPADQPPHA